MRKILIVISLPFILAACNLCNDNNDISNSTQNSNEITNKDPIDEKEKLSEIWENSKIPTTFDELKPYLLDGCWVYVHQDEQNYSIVELIAFTDFPVLINHDYYTLTNEDCLYGNVISMS